jgi:hypothetical protein
MNLIVAINFIYLIINRIKKWKKMILPKKIIEKYNFVFKNAKNGEKNEKINSEITKMQKMKNGRKMEKICKLECKIA